MPRVQRGDKRHSPAQWAALDLSINAVPFRSGKVRTSTPYPMTNLTCMLQNIDSESPPAGVDLLSLVYTELRRVATAKMGRESSAHTLQPTALVHEAWMR